jgi:NADH:ubiquinone oxidoreductase subunit 6 (subunit J)
MKLKPDKKQITWGITLFVTAVAILFVYYIMFHESRIGDGLKSLFSMLSCIIWGIVIALIMSPLLNFFENKWLKKRYLKKGIDVSKPSNARQWRAMRRFSILLTEVILIAILTVLILIIVPSMVDSLTNIAANFNSYMKNAGNSIEALFDSAQNPNKELENTIVSYFNDYSGKISSYITDTVLPNLNNVLKTVSSSVSLASSFPSICCTPRKNWPVSSRNSVMRFSRKAQPTVLSVHSVLSTRPLSVLSAEKFWIPSLSASCALREQRSWGRPMQRWFPWSLALPM